jgi:hypothetical protein
MKTRRFLIFVALVFLIGLALWARFVKAAQSKSASLKCRNNMVAFGYGAHSLAANGDGKYPTNFLYLRDYFGPSILICPGDSTRVPATSWEKLNDAQCSYEIVSPGMSVWETNRVFFRCKVHGHLGYGDMTVFDGKSRGLKTLW